MCFVCAGFFWFLVRLIYEFISFRDRHIRCSQFAPSKYPPYDDSLLLLSIRIWNEVNHKMGISVVRLYTLTGHKTINKNRWTSIKHCQSALHTGTGQNPLDCESNWFSTRMRNYRFSVSVSNLFISVFQQTKALKTMKRENIENNNKRTAFYKYMRLQYMTIRADGKLIWIPFHWLTTPSTETKMYKVTDTTHYQHHRLCP